MVLLAEGVTSFQGRPRYDGMNISTFIGFKNFLTLAEEAVLEHFRACGYGPQSLFSDFGLGLELVDSSGRLTNTLHGDDLVVGTVTAKPAKNGPGLNCAVSLSAVRGDQRVPVLAGKHRVVLLEERDGTPTRPVPEELAPYVVPELAVPGTDLERPQCADRTPARVLAGPGTNGFLWSWTIPYYFCHYYTRLQSNGYVRLLEEAVDRYLAHVGLSITERLATHNWIPVVSRARVRMHADAHLGETLHLTFTVDDVIKETVFTATMAAYVQRGDELIRTATATIMHGWVPARGAAAFSQMVPIDEVTAKALYGGRP